MRRLLIPAVLALAITGLVDLATAQDKGASAPASEAGAGVGAGAPPARPDARRGDDGMAPPPACSPKADAVSAVQQLHDDASKIRQVRVVPRIDRLPDDHRLDFLVFEPPPKPDATAKEQTSYRVVVIALDSDKGHPQLTGSVRPAQLFDASQLDVQEATKGTGGTDFRKEESSNKKTLVSINAVVTQTPALAGLARVYVIGCTGASDQPQFYGSYTVKTSNTLVCAAIAIGLCVLAYGLAAVAAHRIHRFSMVDKRPDANLGGVNYASFWEHLNPVILTAGSNGKGSPTKLQLLWFSLIIFGTVFFIWLLTGRMTGLSDNVLLMMGITGIGATAAAGADITKNRLSFSNWAWLVNRRWLPKGGVAEVNKAEWKDIIMVDGEFDVYRFQMVTFSFLVGLSLIWAGASQTDLSSFDIPTAFTGILGLSQVVYIAGKLTAPPAIADLDKQIGELQKAEAGLRAALDPVSLAEFSRADIWLGPVTVLDKPRKAFDDYAAIWESTRTQFEATLGRLVPNAAGSQRPPFRVPAAVNTKTFELPAATLGQPYAEQLVAAGAKGAYTFAASPPTQAGLTISSAGLISGKPTGTPQELYFMVQVAVADPAIQDPGVEPGAVRTFKISVVDGL